MQQAPREVAGFIEPVGEDEMPRRGAEVGQFQAQLADRFGLAVPPQSRGHRQHEREIVVGVRARARRRRRHGLSAASSAYSRTIASSENTDRPRPRSVLTSEASTRAARASRLSAVPRPARTDRLDGVECEPGDEHAEVVEQFALLVGKQAHAPVDRRAHGPVPLGEVACGGRQQRKAAARVAARSPTGSRMRTFAAASSIARGSPSRRRQMSAMSAAFSSVTMKPGLAASARSTNSAHAEERRARSW